jgi:hypothetical protein
LMTKAKFFILMASLLFVMQLISQPESNTYAILVKKAKAEYKAKAFKKSALTYSEAFKIKAQTPLLSDRYSAARSWSLAGNKDSAFSQLLIILKDSAFNQNNKIAIDPSFNALHKDSRWSTILENINNSKAKIQIKINQQIHTILDTLYAEDQKYNIQMDTIHKKYGWKSKEIQAHLAATNKKDVIKLVKVKSILDAYGWLDADDIGNQGAVLMLMTIQQAGQATWEKYLPSLRLAFKKGKVQAKDLAELEDLVALAKKYKQIYGTQIYTEPETNKWYVAPLDDPDNVDKRRKSLGLAPIADYLVGWLIKWDVKQYKKDLKEMGRLEKRKRK